MRLEWDDAKRAANLAKHGVDFPFAERFDFETARIDPDVRHDYGEPRYTAQGYIGTRLHVLIFTLRGDAVRIISLRKANRREVKAYGQG